MKYPFSRADAGDRRPQPSLKTERTFMKKESLYKAFETKYEELKAALAGDDLDRMKQLALERSNPWCPKSGS